MKASTRPRVKICCISSHEEAEMAIRAGASALGLVGQMPSGPGVIPDGLIREIATVTPPPIATFLLTSETQVEGVIAHHRRARTSTVQLVDALQGEHYRELRETLPGVKLVQVIHVLDENSVAEAVRLSAEVDALLLDSGNPNLAVKELGGTGRVHDWGLSREIREASHVPVFLAGGLHAGNVGEAIQQVGPFGLDLCSGVRTDGVLDQEKLKAFFGAVGG